MVAPLFFLHPNRSAPAPPARLRIPSIGVDAPVDAVGVTAAGTLAMPVDTGRLGWYAPGVRPGQAGDAVIAADLDGERAAVLRRLAELRPGDRVELDLTDGSSLTFQVSSASGYAADRLPADLFERGGRARLSLVASTSSPVVPHSGPPRIVVEATLR
jgi:sortase (surface protein transpeptidase)